MDVVVELWRYFQATIYPYVRIACTCYTWHNLDDSVVAQHAYSENTLGMLT